MPILRELNKDDGRNREIHLMENRDREIPPTGKRGRDREIPPTRRRGVAEINAPKRIAWLFVLLCVLAACSEQDCAEKDDSTIRLAAWNIRIFSDNSRDDEELRLIADVLADYDFIAIVELRDEGVLKRTENILRLMGRDYDYLMSRPVGARVKERYAYLFDRQRFDVLEDGMVFPDPDDDFLREPYFASFRAGKFDFTAITAHVIWGDSVAARRREVGELADVYRAVQAMNGSEQDVILLGDFNRNPDDIAAYHSLMSISTMVRLFTLPQKSHIRDTSLYDNIFFQSSYVTEYTGNSGIDRFDETDFGDDDKAASLAASDHRPVWAEFRIDTDDD